MLRRLFARRAVPVVLALHGAVALASACSPSAGGAGVGDSGAGTSGAGGTAPAGGTAGVPIGGSTAGTIPGGNTGTGGGPDCAGELTTGEPVPVDVYIMLDISGSMLATTGGTSSKWDAVKGAITSFLADEKSSGLGVAIQYFPLQSPGVAATCAASAECGAAGPCLMKGCAAYTAGYVACETDADCDDALVKDDGPCEAGFCRLSGAACADDTACQVRAPNVGPCWAIGRCQNAMDNVCLTPPTGTPTLCSAGNPCVASTASTCVHEALCDQSAYATPAVEFVTLPDTSGALVASLNAQTPRGETPSRPALRGAIDHARAWAMSRPGHSVVVVLATDGLPTDCGRANSLHPSSAAEVDEVIAVATEGLGASPNISTFVVGIFAGNDTTAPANLDRIAAAGGTERAYMVDATSASVNTEFATKLAEIRASRLGCEFQIPTPPTGQSLDFNYVNVVLRDAADTPTDIPRVLGGADRCAEVGGGWYYDPDPAAGTPTRIVACPTTCGTLTTTTGGSVQVKLGCRTIER